MAASPTIQFRTSARPAKPRSSSIPRVIAVNNSAWALACEGVAALVLSPDQLSGAYAPQPPQNRDDRLRVANVAAVDCRERVRNHRGVHLKVFVLVGVERVRTQLRTDED